MRCAWYRSDSRKRGRHQAQHAMNIDLQGLCYLAAWDRGLAFGEGMSHDSSLRRFNLDYSWHSLTRIDAFLDQLRQAEHFQADTFLADPGNQNLLYFLAFYAGEVRARSMGVPARWASWDELLEMHPEMHILGAGFHSSLVQIRPGPFLPLVAISARLFEGAFDKSVASSAGMELDVPQELAGIPASVPLPPIPSQSLMPSYADKFARMPQARREAYLHPVYPDWPAAIVERMRAATPTLLREGRMVWAAIIRANRVLYEGSADAAPAEIVYDPRGMVDPDILNNAVATLWSLKGKVHASPELQQFATHLLDEATPLLDWRTPPELMPYPLSTCPLLISATALPGRRIAMKSLPVLVSDRHPGVAMVAPQELWPAALLKQWLGELPPQVQREAATWLAAGLPDSTPPPPLAIPPQAVLDTTPAMDPIDMARATQDQERIAQRRRVQRLASMLTSGCLLLLAAWTMWGGGYFD